MRSHPGFLRGSFVFRSAALRSAGQGVRALAAPIISGSREILMRRYLTVLLNAIFILPVALGFASASYGQQVAVPTVVGDTQTAASTAITGVGLAVGIVGQTNSTTVPFGDVISESPVAGAMVDAGSSVNLVLSTGPQSGPAQGEWTWVNGANVAGQLGTYGTLGTPAGGNIPAERRFAASWTDPSGNFWLFGGYGPGSLNDLWRYSAGEWAWMSGSTGINQQGTYGTLGTPAASNVPGAREGAASWTDSSGDLWLFGGQGYGPGETYGDLNDLWEYSAGEWTWMAGSLIDEPLGTFGTRGTAAASNVPGTRQLPASCTDTSGNFGSGSV
jgi:hypothetical protein